MTLRVSTEWAEWIEEILPEIAPAENVRYELTMVISEQGPAMIVVVFAPGVILGTTIHSVAVIPGMAAIHRDALENIMRGMIEALAQERSRQATLPPEGQIVTPPPSPNGQPGGHLRPLP